VKTVPELLKFVLDKYKQYPFIKLRLDQDWCEHLKNHRNKILSKLKKRTVRPSALRMDKVHAKLAMAITRTTCKAPITLGDFIKKSKRIIPGKNYQEKFAYMTHFISTLGENGEEGGPYYYVDNLEATLFPPPCNDSLRSFNLRSTSVGLTRALLGGNSGIDSSWLLVGRAGTFFPLHIEDLAFLSLNFMHEGAAKLWVGTTDRRILQVARETFLTRDASLHGKNKCRGFISHKTCFLSPELMLDSSLPLFKAIQEPNDLIVTTPYGYHSGKNTGFSLCEAINCSSEEWIGYYKYAPKFCTCKRQTDPPLTRAQVKRKLAAIDPKFKKMWAEAKDPRKTNP
jgi:hypothetical protein